MHRQICQRRTCAMADKRHRRLGISESGPTLVITDEAVSPSRPSLLSLSVIDCLKQLRSQGLKVDGTRVEFVGWLPAVVTLVCHRWTE